MSAAAQSTALLILSNHGQRMHVVINMARDAAFLDHHHLRAVTATHEAAVAPGRRPAPQSWPAKRT
jgi:hypothetical protein